MMESFKEYFPNGQLKSEYQYVGDQKHCPQKEYFPNGQLKSVCHYFADQKHGSQEEYSEDE